MKPIPSMVSLRDKEFKILSGFIYENVGIKMPPVKKVLLESRLQKRLRTMGIKSFEQYCEYLFSNEGKQKELPFFIDKITTNKTDFFREPDHFEFLTNQGLPCLVESKKGNFRISAWSAGCSTGDEPYTLAMVLSEFGIGWGNSKMDFSILATDISHEVLEKGRMGIYPIEKVDPVPFGLKKRYLLKSKDPKQRLVRIVPGLRKKIVFRQLNLMDQDYGIQEKMDLIFCRNVIIYFDKKVQNILLNKLCRHLKPEGYLLLGHSESLQGLEVPLKSVRPTVFQLAGKR